MVSELLKIWWDILKIRLTTLFDEFFLVRQNAMQPPLFQILQRSHLGLSIGLMACILVAVSVHTLRSMNRLALLTTKLYNHPFTVNKAVLRVENGIVSMHRSMKDVTLAKNQSEIKVATEKVAQLEQAVFDDFEIILAQFLGDKVVIKEARHKFADWKPIRDRVIQLREAGQVDQAAAITKGEGAEYIESLLADIDEVEAFAANKAIEFLNDAQQTQQFSL